MNMAINTDFAWSYGSPEKALKLISESRFTHLHWCHQWNTDFLYGSAELEKCSEWLKVYGLKLLDIHASCGVEKCWFSPVEYQRKAGVELVLNRIAMFSELGGSGSVIMHVPAILFGMTEEEKNVQKIRFAALKRSLDELMGVLEKSHVRLAVENGHDETFEMLAELMKMYPEEQLGITYDSGHGNFRPSRETVLAAPLKGRVQAVHLNDNNSDLDQHLPPFMGTEDWDSVARFIAESSYRDRPMSFEICLRFTEWFDPAFPPESQPEKNMRMFLSDAFPRCEKVVKMVEDYRNAFDRKSI